MLIDHHTHTQRFSFDGRQSLADLAQAARRLSLDGICLTDHYEKDVSYIDGQEAIFDLDDYLTALAPLRQADPGRGPLFLTGIELGYLPHLDDSYADLTARYAFDAVILSLHIFDQMDPYADNTLYRFSRDHVYGRYLECLCEMIPRCPDFDILGHYDYICRYATYPDRKITWNEQADRFDALLRQVIAHHKTLEVNTATIRKLMRTGYDAVTAWPDPGVIRRYLELGGEMICIGSDAHGSDEVGSLIPQAAEWLKSLGVRYLAHYIGRNPVMTSL